MIFITLQRYDVFCSLTIPLVWHSIYQTFGILLKNGDLPPFPLNLVKSLRQVGNNVVDVLSTDTQADG